MFFTDQSFLGLTALAFLFFVKVVLFPFKGLNTRNSNGYNNSHTTVYGSLSNK